MRWVEEISRSYKSCYTLCKYLVILAFNAFLTDWASVSNDTTFKWSNTCNGDIGGIYEFNVSLAVWYKES